MRTATVRTCKGNVRLWMRGDDVFRVTARKDQWGEVEEWICNECRFEKKKVSDWTIEGPTELNRHSVINAGHYNNIVKPKETFNAVMKGRDPKLLMDIHSVSDVNTWTSTSWPDRPHQQHSTATRSLPVPM
jgi:NADH-quinone oxidoreductase subunit G